MINFFIYSIFGMIFGSIVAIFHNDSAFIIKLAVIVIIFNIIFLILNQKVFKNIYLKYYIKYAFVFLLSFIIYNIYIFSFVKDKIHNKQIFIKDNLTIINKIEKDNKITFDLIDNNQNKYYFTQNTQIHNKDTGLQNLNINDNKCFDIEAYTSHNIYNFNKNINNSFDVGLYYQGQGYDYYIKSITVIEDNNCKSDKTLSFLNQILVIKNKISQKSLEYFRTNLQLAGADNYETSLMMAMSWGDEKLLTKNTEDMFRDSGLSHILVLSGFNLSVILASVFILLKNISVRKKIILSFLFLLIFMTVSNTSIPVWRAFIMAFYGLMAFFCYKQADIKYSLWLSLFIFGVTSPLALILDMSLHLSFLATLGIIYIYEPLENFTYNILKSKNKEIPNINSPKYLTDYETINNIIQKLQNFKIKELLISTILISISASIVIIPYVIFQFNTYNFFSIIFNILITFMIPVVTILSVILSLLYIPILSETLQIITNICIKGISYFANISANINNKNYIIELNFYEMIIIYIIIFILYKIILLYNKINS